ncbi:hypothetical protein SGHV062 [Enterococcus mundtii QU 25]|uniref:DUF4062 domain-containing protein n=1 Tax=Enterococcus mundtii TaxID=53346 RepID=UPI0003C55D52|nr:DUF4062 domain-containing protein [Enterococcus mundtii]BAO06343.1 hypothetical protein SGHV062 [Enterococcus mundtii QU 25]
MEKKYQIFISSTYLDLKEERQKVVEAVLSAGHIPAGMELFHAGDETQKELIEEWINDSDIYVLILGGRYGSLDSDGQSYTEWEYDKAKELNKPRFSLVLTKEYLDNKVHAGLINGTDLEYNTQNLVDFRDKVKSKIVSEINNIEQIEAEVFKAINRISSKQSENLEGWIKGSWLSEIERLKKENADLSSQLVSRQSEVIDMQKELSATKDNYVGEYNFSYVKKVLANKKIKSDILNEKLQELEEKKSSEGLSIEEQKSYEELSKFKSEELSALEYILKNKNKLLTDGLILYSNIVHDIFSSEIISVWNQLSLIDKVRIKPQVGSFLGNMYDKVTLNENGKKFISMIEIEQSNNAKA